MHSRLRVLALPALLVTAALTLALPPVAVAESPALPSIDEADSASGARPPANTTTPVWAPVPGSSGIAPSTRRSAADAAVEDATLPGVPVVSLAELHPTAALFNWSAADGGAPITEYTLRLSIGGTVIDEAPWTDSAEVWITDLEPETTYSFSVAAVNSVGAGPFSEEYEFTTTLDFIERQYGLNRFETAARVSYRAFPFSGGQIAVLANGLNFPDALAGAAAAGSFGGPVLLTEAGSLPAATSMELAALSPEFVVVAGGRSSVSDGVASQAWASATVEGFRLAGTNRFGTAEQMSLLWESADVVYLANGMNFPDALAGAAAAGAVGAPVLLTETNALPAETARALASIKPAKIVVLGGSGSVSASVVSKAVAATGVSTTTQRLSGANRFETAAAISKASFPEPGVPVVYVASGASFADALAGAAAAGYRGGPVLLTEGSSAPSSLLSEIARLQPERIVVLGGPTIVTDRVIDQIASAAG